LTTEQGIRENPHLHQHNNLNELNQCCYIDGAIDLSLVDVHGEISERSNGGVRCDVFTGPCSCGAWH